LFAAIRRARLVVWAISLAGAVALWLLLLPLVRQVYGREVREATLRAYAGRLEAEVAERTQQLVHAQKLEAVGTLAGAVAHDFNNLLTIVLGRCDALRRAHAGQESVVRGVEVIASAAGRAAALTRQLLAFSRRQALHPVVLDVNEVVGQMQMLVQPLLGDGVALL